MGGGASKTPSETLVQRQDAYRAGADESFRRWCRKVEEAGAARDRRETRPSRASFAPGMTSRLAPVRSRASGLVASGLPPRLPPRLTSVRSGLRSVPSGLTSGLSRSGLSMFSDEDSFDADEDSVSGRFEKKCGSTVIKRVAVASIVFSSFLTKEKSLSRVDFARYSAGKLSAIQKLVEEQKGDIHSIEGPHLTVSFNAVRTITRAVNHACELVERLRELEAKDGCSITAGIACEKVAIDDWIADSIISKIGEKATVLQGMCSKYSGAHCLIPQSLYDDLSSAAILECIDLVRMPVFDIAQPVFLVSVHSLKQGGDEEEWMYQLESAERDNPYSRVNAVFQRFSHGATSEHLQEMINDIGSNARECGGYLNIKRLVDCLVKVEDRDAAICQYLGEVRKGRKGKRVSFPAIDARHMKTRTQSRTAERASLPDIGRRRVSIMW